MLIALYILLGISILAPIYTYALYPFVLKLFPHKRYTINEEYKPSVSVVIVGGDEYEYAQKKRNIKDTDYPIINEIKHASSNENPLAIIKATRSEAIVITDATSVFLKGSVSQAIKALSPSCIGCVSGMVRKAPDDNGEFHDGANWKYENKIKALESNIGCLSGANAAFYIIKRECLPIVNQTKINIDFLLPTCVTEKGLDVILEPQAVAYEVEKRSEGDLFKKHIADGASGYRSIARFWRMLFPCKGSFVFWSHRVMKWLVPFNMLILLVGCGLLACRQSWALLAFCLQIVGYLYLTLYYQLFSKKEKKISGVIGKLSDFASYFLVLNVAWFLGLITKKRAL